MITRIPFRPSTFLAAFAPVLTAFVLCAAPVLVGRAAETTAAAGASSKMKRVLFFTKSSGYEHAVIKEGPNGEPSFVEKILTVEGPKHGIAFTFSKDGSLFSKDYLAQFDAIFFYTSGDLLAAGTDKNPPMTPAGKAALLAAIHGGKGFIGTHSASDTFHTGETVDTDTSGVRTKRYVNHGDKADPYVRMLGAEFIVHDKQQVAKALVVDDKFPGTEDLGEVLEIMEEWYSLADFSSNLHVLLVTDTNGMVGPNYQRPPFPNTWARTYGRGRVFYSALGHREETWQNPAFQKLLFGGIAWAVRNVDADVTPNLSEAAPGALKLQPIPAPAKPASAPQGASTPKKQ